MKLRTKFILTYVAGIVTGILLLFVVGFFAKKFVLSMIICIFAALVPAEPLYNA